MELAPPDVERDHARRAALEQDVREAACRRADVQRIAAGRVDAELVEGMRELVAAPRHEPRRRFDDEHRGFVHLLTCLLVAVDEARHDERLRLSAALGEPAFDQQDIQALAHSQKASPPSAPLCDAFGQDRIRTEYALVVQAAVKSLAPRRQR